MRGMRRKQEMGEIGSAFVSHYVMQTKFRLVTDIYFRARMYGIGETVTYK